MIEQYFVSSGISGGPQTWCTYTRRPSGSLKRVCSPMLPLRPTRLEALQDLQSWLWAKQATAGQRYYDAYAEQAKRIGAEIAAEQANA